MDMSISGRLNQLMLNLMPLSTLFLINIVYATCVLVNFLACVLRFMAVNQAGGMEVSWLTAVGAQ